MVYVVVANENTIESQVNGQEHRISYEIWQHNEQEVKKKCPGFQVLMVVM